MISTLLHRFFRSTQSSTLFTWYCSVHPFIHFHMLFQPPHQPHPPSYSFLLYQIIHCPLIHLSVSLTHPHSCHRIHSSFLEVTNHPLHSFIHLIVISQSPGSSSRVKKRRRRRSPPSATLVQKTEWEVQRGVESVSDGVLACHSLSYWVKKEKFVDCE